MINAKTLPRIRMPNRDSFIPRPPSGRREVVLPASALTNLDARTVLLKGMLRIFRYSLVGTIVDQRGLAQSAASAI